MYKGVYLKLEVSRAIFHKILASTLGDHLVMRHQEASEHMKGRTACQQILCMRALL